MKINFSTSLFIFLIFLAWDFVAGQTGAPYDPANLSFAKELKKKEKWLKIEVIRLEKDVFNNADVTHIDSSGAAVYYMGGDNIFRKATRFTSADEFVNEHRSRLRDFTITRWPVGTKVLLHKVNLLDRDVDIGVTNPSGNKSTIHLNLEKKNYKSEDIRKLLSYALADSANELVAKTIKLELGMSVDDVIKIKGSPKTRADLGTKVVLTYDDMKVIFQDGKLVDVQ